VALSIIDTSRRQWAVYWPPAGTDPFGQPKYGNPANARVRWVQVTETFVNAKGQEQQSTSVVSLGDDVKENGVLWLGPGDGLGTEDPLAGLDAAHRADPFKNAGAYTISKVMKVPTVRADQFLRVAYL
jgi:hypothetical protein